MFGDNWPRIHHISTSSEQKCTDNIIQITADDDDCNHEIKKHLLLERRAMTNLDHILKSRDITFQTKVHIDKAMVFPVVMYGCES